MGNIQTHHICWICWVEQILKQKPVNIFRFGYFFWLRHKFRRHMLSNFLLPNSDTQSKQKKSTLKFCTFFLFKNINICTWTPPANSPNNCWFFQYNYYYQQSVRYCDKKIIINVINKIIPSIINKIIFTIINMTKITN